MKKPGYETTEQLWSPNPRHLKRFADKHIIPFLIGGGIKEGDVCWDIGEYNPRIKYIAERTNFKINTINTGDFNWDELYKRPMCYRIFAFEIIEHLQNPLFFMKQLKEILSENGSIYVIMPCNPVCLWHEMHFFEMDKNHFEKWILNPIGLKIVRYKKIYFFPPLRTYLIGFRPLFRLLVGKTSFKTFIRSLFYVQYGIYEVKNEKYN